MLYLRVGNGCLADRTPVDDTGSLVNVSFFVQLDKYFTALHSSSPHPW